MPVRPAYERVTVRGGTYSITVSRVFLADAPEPGTYYRWHRIPEDLFIQTTVTCSRSVSRGPAILNVTLRTLTFDEPFLPLDTVCRVSGYWRRVVP